MKRGEILQPSREEEIQYPSLFNQKKNSRGKKVSRPSQLALLSIALLLVATGLLSFLSLNRNDTRAASPLPGQQTWSQGTSSFLFGANDASWGWSPTNMGNNPAVAAAVRAAGITVIRTPLNAGDAQARVAVVEAAGAKCLGILSAADAEQVVQQLGDRCDMYEWTNEPDNAGISAQAYAASWNQYIPRLRSINPNARFIGPVVASPNTPFIQQFLTLAKQAGNLPDAVSYHMYPCTDQPISGCPAHIADFTTAANQVRAAVHTALGMDIPLAVTEWNYSWKANQTPQADPYMTTFTQQALQAMAVGGVSLANQFDLASGGSLDMIHPQNAGSTPQLQGMQQMINQFRGATLPPTVSVSPTGTLTSSTATPPGTVTGGSPASLVLGQQVVCQAGTVTQPLGPPGTQPGTATPTAAASLPPPLSTPGTSLLTGCTLGQQLPAGQYLMTWWAHDSTIASSLSLVTPSGTYQTSAGGGVQEINLGVAGSVQVVLAPPTTGTLTEDIALYQLGNATTPVVGTPTVPALPTIPNPGTT